MQLELRGLALTLGTLGLVCGIAPWAAFRPAIAADAPGAAKDAQPKADHPTVSALRMRLMTEFHGGATDVFTSIPGFGYERMMPVYDRIPWEIPHFSTNDVEVEKAPGTPKLLKDVFAKSLESFEKSKAQEAAKADAPKTGATTPPIAVPQAKPGFGSPQRGTIVHGVQLRMLDLIGNLDPARPKVYSGGKAFELVRSKRLGKFGQPGALGQPGSVQQVEQASQNMVAVDQKQQAEAMKERPLDLFETAGLAELVDGKETFVREKGNVIRMMGALRAGDQCLKCHTEHHKGDLLGALSYTFLDTGGVLKEANKKQP